MCSRPKNVIIPPHPTPALDLVWHPLCVQGQKKLSSHPTRPQPQVSCRIDHVCKAKERYHPTPPHPTPASGLVSHRPCVQGQRTLSSHPTPPDPWPKSCVASTMCWGGESTEKSFWIQRKKFLNPTKKVSESNEKSFWIQRKKFLNPTKKVSESNEKSFWIQRKKFLNPTKKVSESNEKSFWIQRKKFLNPTKKVSESNEKSFWIQRREFLNPPKKFLKTKFLNPTKKFLNPKVSESDFVPVSEDNVSYRFLASASLCQLHYDSSKSAPPATTTTDDNNNNNHRIYCTSYTFNCDLWPAKRVSVGFCPSLFDNRLVFGGETYQLGIQWVMPSGAYKSCCPARPLEGRLPWKNRVTGISETRVHALWGGMLCDGQQASVQKDVGPGEEMHLSCPLKRLYLWDGVVLEATGIR